MKLLDALRSKRAKELQSTRGQYRALLERAAKAGGELSAADTDRLAELAAQLGGGADEIESDLRAVIALMEAQARVNDPAGQQEEFERAKAAWKALVDERDKFNPLIEEAWRKFEAVEIKVLAVNGARQSVEDIKGNTPRVYGE